MSKPDILSAKRLKTAERKPAANEFFVRGHHPRTHRTFIAELNHAPEGSTIREIASILGEKDAAHFFLIKTIIERNGIEPHQFGFRREYGVKSSDERYPLNYPSDLIGEDPNLYAQKRAADYLEFATRPPSHKAVLGAHKDGICRSCIFGDGEGGLHCSVINFNGESEMMINFLNSADEYFSSVKTKTRGRRTNYSQKSLKVDETRFDPPDEWVEYDEGSMYKRSRTREVHSVTMPMGLYRDIQTWIETRGEYFTFQELIKSRGLVA